MTSERDDSTPNPAPITSDEESYEEEEEDAPDNFICPLTLEVMEDPLMDRRGMNFERKAIVEWLNRGNTTCPLTREPLSYSKLIPNAALRMKIERWKIDNGMDVVSTYAHKAHRHEYLCMIEAPADSMLNDRWEEISNDLQQQMEHSNNDTISRRRRRRIRIRNRVRAEGDSTISPRTGRRRSLAGILDSALSVVRRNPVDVNEQS